MSSQDGSLAGSDAPGRKLLSLAPEVVEHVIKQVEGKKDLSNTRLVCRELDRHAAKVLFEVVFLSPSKKRIKTWNSISLDENIRRIPRHAVIHTHSDIKDHGLGAGTREPEGNGDKFHEALAALSRLPNLGSIEIAFTPECLGERENRRWEEVAEDASSRRKNLELIFQAIRNRAADEGNRTIKKLTITNLQNCPIPGFTSSDLFRDVMGQLDELHLSLIQEYNEAGPDHDYARVELQTFPAHLCSEWLRPISGNLKALSLYHKTDNWGPFPGYFDPSGILFPKLETLALGHYTLAHDGDIDWILSIKSLRKLIMHNCMIASWICIDEHNMAQWKVPTTNWTRLPDDGEYSNGEHFSYGGKWSHFLDRIAADLPNLMDFRFDQISYRDKTPYGLEHRDTCRVRISPQRYICFDNCILPSHWSDADDEGEMESCLEDGFPTNVHQDSLEEDQESLDRLLDKLRKSSTAQT
ncbi:hypothetical protein KVR01_006867 [Diaporthe batatas]|uniref:uncharacterized protein n=1 Tax=Diaporthe batatas TaxID=748121 RepID=UPI001D04B803|nr:uncharacterized protein KVR01_006867 [Diaporthe batatas]KAG8163570.1 hypothetical protein KVR01_006867 [Diaporthe batatas]